MPIWLQIPSTNYKVFLCTVCRKFCSSDTHKQLTLSNEDFPRLLLFQTSLVNHHENTRRLVVLLEPVEPVVAGHSEPIPGPNWSAIPCKFCISASISCSVGVRLHHFSGRHSCVLPSPCFSPSQVHESGEINFRCKQLDKPKQICYC